MHKLKTLALVALAAFGLTARGAVTTNDWWDVSFESNSFQTGFEGLITGQLGSLTNNEADMPDGTVQPYAAGVWTMIDGDESYITNGLVTNFLSGVMTEVPNSVYLKLDTQGNDLTWSVVPTNQMGAKLKALVDADLYLVGSDSAPDAGDFDSNEDVQTAVYLMNEIDPDSGETTNSVLCVYVYNAGTKANEWQELAGEKLEDNAWAHVQVLVDHTDPENLPSVKVYVNGTEMHARNGAATSWPAANGDKSQTTGKVSSVAFRGTGAVDNFVGKTIEETFSSYDFTAEVYMNDTLVAQGNVGNVTRVVNAEAGAGKTATFRGFQFHDYVAGVTESSYCLTKIEIIDQGDDSVQTLNYTYQNHQITPETVSSAVYFHTDITYDEDENGDPVEIEYQTGEFDVFPSTEGATANGIIAKIYFEDVPEEGTYNAQATTTLGGTTTTDSQKVKPSDFTEENPTKTITWTFDAEKNGNVLSTIQLYNGATLEYANKTATVTVTTNAALQADTLFAAATYAPGSLAEGQDLEWTVEDGLYTFTSYTPPVAIRITVAEGTTTTNKYPSLLGAITNAVDGDTIYLVADDHVSFTEDEPEIMIADISLTIDGNGHTLYGLTDYGASYHDIFIGPTAGNVTIKNLKFTEFGDTAAFSDMMTPIVTSGSYAGMLTLDGVTIDKFIRQAVLICGGDFLITNCTITGSTAGTEYFQSAIEVFNATGTVVNTTITGIGAKGKTFINPDTNEEDEWKAAVFTIDPAGFGKIMVESGSYTGEFITSFNKETTGSIVLEGGTFVATAEAGQSAFLDDSETGSTLSISGGWFDREPAAAFIAEGLSAVNYGDAAPTPAAPWTVEGQKVQIDFYVDDAIYASTNVEVGTTGYAPANPTKEDTAQYAYAFTGWTNAVGEAYSAATAATTATNYYAVFAANVRSYEVEWIVDGVYTTNTWNYNATPSWNENDATAVPTKDSTAATNFTFKAWDPEVTAVTGPGASYTATWTESARKYWISWVVDGTTTSNEVEYGTVPAYAGEEPSKEGYTFLGWNSDSTATTAFSSLPPVTGEAKYYAVFREDSGVVKVDAGDGLAQYKIDNPQADVPKPIEINSTTGKAEISFVAPAAGRYVLFSSTTVNGTYTEDAASAQTVAEGDLVTLTEGSTGTTKFFKIGYGDSTPEP